MQISCDEFSDTFYIHHSRCKQQTRLQILLFQIRVICQNFLLRHIGSQHLQDIHHRIAKSSHRRFAITNIRIDRNSLYQISVIHIAKIQNKAWNCKARRKVTSLIRFTQTSRNFPIARTRMKNRYDHHTPVRSTVINTIVGFVRESIH